MYQRVFSRPFLFQESASKKQKNQEVEKGKIVELLTEKPLFLDNQAEKQFPVGLINFSGEEIESVKESSIISRKSA